MLRVAFDASLAVLLAGVALNSISYALQRRKLRAVVEQLTVGCAEEIDAVLAVAKFIYANVTRAKDPVFLTPLLAPLGGSPLAILRQGGCCSGIHRLFIACLGTIGIRAAQITLYPHSGRWCHCAVQVTLRGTVCIIDVDYGVIYEGPRGEFMGLRDLRSGIVPSFRVFANGLSAPLCAGYYRDSSPGYPSSSYYDFDFCNTRTANWQKSWVRRRVYALLRVCSLGQVDSLFQPPLLEWPQMFVSVSGLCLALALFIARVAGAA